MRPLPWKVLMHWNPDLYSVEGGCILDSGVSEVWVRSPHTNWGAESGRSG